jgi:hypothetical protein
MARKNAKRKVKIEQKPLWLLKYLALGKIPEPKQEGVLECFMLRGNRRNEKKMWEKYKNFILADWLQNRPGTRPWAWWRFDAPRWQKSFNGAYFEGTLPEPRQRVGGVGGPQFEHLGVKPRFSFGVPVDWLDQFMADYYNGRARDKHGEMIPCKYKEGDFSGVALDLDNPPLYESEASYLKRHGLLTKSEEKRLSDKDFEPGSCLKYIKNYEK